MERRIQAGEDRGALSHFDADGDRSRLTSIRDMQARLRDDHDGLTGDDRADLGSRLDDLSASVNAQWRGGDDALDREDRGAADSERRRQVYAAFITSRVVVMVTPVAMWWSPWSHPCTTRQ